MTTRRKVLVAAGAALALAAGGVGVAAAGGDDDDGERPITGAALERASAAALREVGDGRVTGTEAGDEESAYEVEVTRRDGRRVDVQLDRAFRVIGTEGDGEAERGRDARSSPAGTAQTADLPRGSEPVDLDPAAFSANVDHRFWPMAPGTRWTYREVDEEGKRLKVVVTATSVTRRIANGIVARVVRDTVTEEGRVVEDTFDWYAQDAAGTVWYLGEDTAEFEDGRVTSRAGSFEAGARGALPGVILPARPRDGMAYRQEYAAGRAEDNGEVLAVGEQAQVPAGHFRGALLTKDTNALESRVLEYKLYAPGVGPVLTLGVSGGGGREELVARRRVGARAARAAGTVALGRSYP